MIEVRRAFPDDRDGVSVYVAEMIGDADAAQIAAKETERYLSDEGYLVYLAFADAGRTLQ